MIRRTQQVASHSEEILEDTVEGEKPLGLASRFESAHLTPLQFSGIVRTELLTPDSDCFIRDDDSALGEKILDVSEAQAETMVNPDSIADDFPRETVVIIGRPT